MFSAHFSSKSRQILEYFFSGLQVMLLLFD
jgi:hypothetical protein